MLRKLSIANRNNWQSGRTQKKPRTKWLHGILLMEVIVTLVLLSVGLTLVTRSFSVSLKAARAVQNYFYAVMRLENLIWDLEEGERDLTDEINQSGEEDDDYGSYDWNIMAEPIMPKGLYQVDMGVKWDEQRRTEGIKITTLVYQPTIDQEE